MPLDNFIVRAKLRSVEKFRDPKGWDDLTLDDRLELIEDVAGLPTAYEDGNLPAKGSILNLDGRELMVSVREESGYAVRCLDSGECFSLTVERVDDAIRERDCEVIKPADAEKRYALRASELLQVETRPAAYIGATAAPGQLMTRGRTSGVVPVRPAGMAPSKPLSASTPPRASAPPPQSAGPMDVAPEKGAASAPDPDDIKTMTFGPIKDSKL